MKVLMKGSNKIVPSFLKQNNKGVSLVELIISASSLCFFALLVNSMLVLGKSFQKSQQHYLDSYQISRMIKQNMCMQNTTFKSIGINPVKSYSKRDITCCIPGESLNCKGVCQCKKDEDGSCKKDSSGNIEYIRTFSREYKKWGVGDSPGESGKSHPLLGLSLKDISEEPNFKSVKSRLENPLLAGEIETKAGKPYYYKLYQDSHTWLKLSVVDMTKLKGFDSGIIFASRCVKNEKESAIFNEGVFKTFDPKALKQSAIYILSELDRRPFYFSDTGLNSEKVKCCKSGPTGPSDCKSLLRGDYISRIYVIHFKPHAEKTFTYLTKEEILAGSVVGIQEMPESQDINNIWSAGFVLSLEEPKGLSLSQSAFYLNTIVLKNSCSSSFTNIEKCPQLNLGDRPSETKLIGLESQDMSQFILPDVSSCAGYSSSVKSTAIISF